MGMVDTHWRCKSKSWVPCPCPFLLGIRVDVFHCFFERAFPESLLPVAEEGLRRVAEEGLRPLRPGRRPERRRGHPLGRSHLLRSCGQVDDLFIAPPIPVFSEWSCRVVEVEKKFLLVVDAVERGLPDPARHRGAVWRPTAGGPSRRSFLSCKRLSVSLFVRLFLREGKYSGIFKGGI